MERLSVDSIFSQSLESLQDQFALWGEPRWRAGQLMEWIYRKFAGGFDECSNLSKPLRAKLKEKYFFSLAPLVTVTGQEHETRKFLWKLEDGNLVESVLIPAGSEEGGRHTLCVSTQVGCAYGCRFCASGRSGFVRDLTAAENSCEVIATYNALLALERAAGAGKKHKHRTLPELLYLFSKQIAMFSSSPNTTLDL